MGSRLGLGLGLGLPRYALTLANQDAEVLAAGKVVARRRRRPRGTPHWRGGGRGCASTSASTVSAWPAGVSHEAEAYCELQNKSEKAPPCGVRARSAGAVDGSFSNKNQLSVSPKRKTTTPTTVKLKERRRERGSPRDRDTFLLRHLLTCFR